MDLEGMSVAAFDTTFLVNCDVLVINAGSTSIKLSSVGLVERSPP